MPRNQRETDRHSLLFRFQQCVVYLLAQIVHLPYAVHAKCDYFKRNIEAFGKHCTGLAIALLYSTAFIASSSKTCGQPLRGSPQREILVLKFWTNSWRSVHSQHYPRRLAVFGRLDAPANKTILVIKQSCFYTTMFSYRCSSYNWCHEQYSQPNPRSRGMWRTHWHISVHFFAYDVKKGLWLL